MENKKEDSNDRKDEVREYLRCEADQQVKRMKKLGISDGQFFEQMVNHLLMIAEGKIPLPQEGNDIANEDWKVKFQNWYLNTDYGENMKYMPYQIIQKWIGENIINLPQSLPIQDIANGRDEVYYKWVKASDETPTKLGQEVKIRWYAKEYMCIVESYAKFVDIRDIKAFKLKGSMVNFYDNDLKDFENLEWLKPVKSLPIEEGKLDKAIEILNFISYQERDGFIVIKDDSHLYKQMKQYLQSLKNN